MTIEPAAAKRLFDAVRQIKRSVDPQAVLTQTDVDMINRALAADVIEAGKGRKASQKGIDLIHSFEQLRLTTYPDPGSRDGKPVTGGWGSTSDENGRPLPLGFTASKPYWDKLFLRDLAAKEAAVNLLLGEAPTTQGQFDALVSFAYNVGEDIDADTIAEGLGDSTLLKRHLAGDYEGAAKAFGSWVYNDGTKLKGLIRRREAEASLYRGGA